MRVYRLLIVSSYQAFDSFKRTEFSSREHSKTEGFVVLVIKLNYHSKERA